MVGLGKNVRLSLLIILSGIISFPFDSFSISSQVVLKNLFTVQKYSALNTGAKEFYLSENEKHIIGLCNLVRYDPKAFVSEIIISSGYDTSNEEISGLIKELKSRKSVFPLMPAFSLFKSALGHAKDMGFNGLSGHNSSDGKTFDQRIQQFFPSNTGFEENYYEGSGDPIEIVMNFLLAKNENGMRYKNNIFDETIHYIGISIQPHRSKCSNAVIDFAKKPNIPVASTKRKPGVEVYWKDCPTGTKISTRRKSGGFSLSSIFGGRK